MLCLAAVAAVAFTSAVHAQTAPPVYSGGTVAPTTSSAVNLYNDVKGLLPSDLGSITNWTIAPYATYAPKAPAGNTVGGGVLAIYDVNSYVGAAVGVDYLGQFSILSGNATLKADTRPFAHIPVLSSYASLSNVVVTPFVLAGIGKPMSGSGGSGVAAIADVGVQTRFGHFLGGRFGAGVCYGQWINAGDYSIKRYHAFLNWQHGF